MPSALLANTTLPIPKSAYAANAEAQLKPLHSSAWWAARTRGMDFSVEDHLDSNKFNRLVWTGTMGNKPYPTQRNGADLSMNRAEFLKNFHAAQARPEQSKMQTGKSGDAATQAAAAHGSK